MKAKTRRKLEMGKRVVEFARMYQDGSAGFQRAVARLEALLTRAERLERQELDGRSEVHAATARKRDLRREIRQAHLDHLINVARIAAAEEPELLQKFAFPRDATTYRAFHTVASTMLTEAEDRKELLLRHGLSEEVLAGLTIGLEELAAAVNQAAAGRILHVGASAELRQVGAEVVQLTKAMKGLIRIRFARRPDALAAWESARNVLAPAHPNPELPVDQASPAGEVRPAA